jgi:hypothetical protein
LCCHAGFIKYFGDVRKTIDSVEKYKTTNTSDVLDTSECLSTMDNTVFISSHWVIDTLKGLIRHDRDCLLHWFIEKFPDASKRSMWLQRVKKLLTHGLLHEELLPYIWPQAQSTQ